MGAPDASDAIPCSRIVDAVGVSGRGVTAGTGSEPDRLGLITNGGQQ